MTAKEALTRLQDLCSRAEHSSGELRTMMRRWGLSADDIARVIARLQADRYVDDARFARAFATDKMRFSRWGRRKIAAGLAAKGVDRTIAAEALDALDEEEYTAVLRHLLEARLTRDPEMAETYQGRTSLYRFGLQRGFESDIVATTLRAVLADSR